MGTRDPVLDRLQLAQRRPAEIRALMQGVYSLPRVGGPPPVHPLAGVRPAR